MNLRLYTFVNFYLSSIQQGIQSAHVLHELFLKYRPEEDEIEEELNPDRQRLYQWADAHKTMIVLNGGINESIIELYEFLEENSSSFNFPAPFANFHEDQQSLGGIMTAVGIVLPEEIYDAVDYNKAKILNNFDPGERDSYFYLSETDYGVPELIEYSVDSTEWKFIKILKGCSLAR